MPNPRLAKRYAKCLIDLAIEKGELESVNKDIEFLEEVIRKVKEVKIVLSSPVIKADKKVAILSAISQGKEGPLLGDMTRGFFLLLLKKSREGVLPEIVDAFIEQYKVIKGINKVRLYTPQPISEEEKQKLMNKLMADSGITNIELESRIDESLVGGFVLEYNNKIVDASLKYDLKSIKKSFQRNDYIFNIR